MQKEVSRRKYHRINSTNPTDSLHMKIREQTPKSIDGTTSKSLNGTTSLNGITTKSFNGITSKTLNSRRTKERAAKYAKKLGALCRSTCRQAMVSPLLRVFVCLVVVSLETLPAMGANNSALVLPSTTEDAIPTPVPEEYFSEQPANFSVVEGDVAIMKCKTKVPVYYCRWYYIELDLDFYKNTDQAKQVKDFKPTQSNDCSIRFTRVRKVQEGQWLCQARQFMKTVAYNSRPAVLQVLTESDEKDYEASLASSEEPLTVVGRPLPPNATVPTNQPPVGERNNLSGKEPSDSSGGSRGEKRVWDSTAPTSIPAMQPPFFHRMPSSHPSPNVPNDAHDDRVRPAFIQAQDDHIQNTMTGGTAMLPCLVDSNLLSCAWIMPNNAVLVRDPESSTGRGLSVNTPMDVHMPSQQYEFMGDMLEGNCSLRLHSVTRHDEGNWRCVVRASTGSISDRLPLHSSIELKGPLIHLHLLDYGVHLQNPGIKTTSDGPGLNKTLISLFLVGLVLFIVGSVIIYCCYKRVWSRADNVNASITKSDSNSPQRRGQADDDYSRQWFHGRNLKIVDPNYTDDFKLRNLNTNSSASKGKSDCKFDPMSLNVKNLNSQMKYNDADHYSQQYMIMNSPDSARNSATSSNTTISTIALDSLCKSPSASYTRSPSLSPLTHPDMTIAQFQFPHKHDVSARTFTTGRLVNPNLNSNPQSPSSPQSEIENVPFYELHGQLQRPVSLYSTGHVYEEIQDKIPPYPVAGSGLGKQYFINSQGMLVPVQSNQQVIEGHLSGTPIKVTTPVYTNMIEDHQGYLIPSKAAKIVNIQPTEEEPGQYLPMKGELTNLSQPTNQMQLEHQHPQLHQPDQQINNSHHQHRLMRQDGILPSQFDMNTLNNLSDPMTPTMHVQCFDANVHGAVANPKRYSNLGPDTIEQNYDPRLEQQEPVSETKRTEQKRREFPTCQQEENALKVSGRVRSSGKRQKMPLPPELQSSANRNFPESSKVYQDSKGVSQNPNGELPPQRSEALHKKTASLPADSFESKAVIAANKTSHTKSPSLIPTSENYDVPRSMANVSRSENGSEISIQNIDGIIV